MTTNKTKGRGTPLPECQIEGCKSTQTEQGLCARDLRTARVMRYVFAQMKVGSVPLLQLLLEVSKPFQPSSPLVDSDGNALIQ